MLQLSPFKEKSHVLHALRYDVDGNQAFHANSRSPKDESEAFQNLLFSF
jgi:hypothetical protein